MDIIRGKLDVIIRLLEQLVDQNEAFPVEIIDDRNLDVLSERELEIRPRLPSLNSLGEGASDDVEIQSEVEEEIVQYNSIQIGELHRLIELEDERTNEINLHIQYWDGHNWITKHMF